jgi:L-threonylcarbamoyladenylate synthase
VTEGLGGRIDAVIDGGASAVGIESTIVGLAGPARILRPGGLPAEALAAVLGGDLPGAVTDLPPGAGRRPTSPGQLASHYAPHAPLRIDAAAPRPGEVWIGFGPGPAGGLSLSPAGDLAEAAAALFHLLREADRQAGPAGAIAVAAVPDRGLGRAINDRLRRAAAPRPAYVMRDGPAEGPPDRPPHENPA